MAPMGLMKQLIELEVHTMTSLWPHKVVNVLQQVMEEGERMHPDGDSWGLTPTQHILHAKAHLDAYTRGDKSEDHLAHAFTRLMMAVAIEKGFVEGGTDGSSS